MHYICSGVKENLLFVMFFTLTNKEYKKTTDQILITKKSRFQ